MFDHGDPDDHRRGRHGRLDDQGSLPSIDELESMAGDAEREIGRLRALQILMLRSLESSGVTFADDPATFAEWIAGRLDVAAQTAIDLSTAVHHMPMDLVGELQQGVVSFDRAMAETRLEMTGVDANRRAISRRLDVDGVDRLAGRSRRIGSADPRRVLRGEPGHPARRSAPPSQAAPDTPDPGAPTLMVHREELGDVADTPATTSSGHTTDVTIIVDAMPASRPPPGRPGRGPAQSLRSARRHQARGRLSPLAD